MSGDIELLLLTHFVFCISLCPFCRFVEGNVCRKFARCFVASRDEKAFTFNLLWGFDLLSARLSLWCQRQCTSMPQNNFTLFLSCQNQNVLLHIFRYRYRYRYRLLYYLNSEKLRVGLHAPYITMTKR